ncbi:serine/threonine-protein kinase gin4 [Microbotryomycetes sp. JL221]|nr:serine/threonine-protein kinase gin4 [Microbotryomycetes sp. JL221]
MKLIGSKNVPGNSTRNYISQGGDSPTYWELYHYLCENDLKDSQVSRWFAQLIQAVSYLHSCCVYHRDIKLENIFLYEDAHGQLCIKLGDLGMATFQGDHKLSQTSCGSPHYAAPEVIKGLAYDAALSDVWSCGVVLFALASYSLPFDDDNLPNLLEKIKAGDYVMAETIQGEARDLISKILVTEPSARISLPEIWQHEYLSKHLAFVPSHRDRAAPKLAVVQIVTEIEQNLLDPDSKGRSHLCPASAPAIINVFDPASTVLSHSPISTLLNSTKSLDSVAAGFSAIEQQPEDVHYDAQASVTILKKRPSVPQKIRAMFVKRDKISFLFGPAVDQSELDQAHTAQQVAADTRNVDKFDVANWTVDAWQLAIAVFAKVRPSATPILDTPPSPMARSPTSYSTKGRHLLESMSAFLNMSEDTLSIAEADREALRRRVREQDKLIRQLRGKVEKLENELAVAPGKSS